VVAIKVVNYIAVPDPTKVALFNREARLIGRLRHPNVVEIYDVGYSKGIHFIEMEFVDGRTVASLLLEKGPRPVAETVGIASQVADVLVEAERRGIVHRDIKPANLLLAEGNFVKLCDFGLAKELEDAGLSDLTKTGTARGTLDFMAPEQIVDARSAGPRSDQYALGATLYQMLTGRARLSGGPLQAYMARIGSEETPPVSHSGSSIPGDLDAAISRMLRRDPAERYPHPEDFRQVFQRFADDNKGESDG
jgi:serine/threonine-protein kinase